MGVVVSVDENGRIVYDGLLTSREKADVDELIQALKTEMPQIESDLTAQYGDGVLYKYYLGLFLGELLEQWDVPFSKRRKFWDGIKQIASKENRIRNEGKNSAVRSFYEQCYVLSHYDLETVQSLSWKQWQDILDRVRNREDERIFDWIKSYPTKFKQEYWSEFEKGLHLYLSEKDTSVFSDDELFEVYDSILAMAKYWVDAFNAFKKEYPNSAKVKSKGRRSKKYQETCFKTKRELREPLSDKIFEKAFEVAMR